MQPATNNLAIVILAGGQATRFPHKLHADAGGGVPLIVRVYRNLAGHFPVYISAQASFPPQIDALLDCPLIVDRWVKRGPLSGILSAFSQISESLVFVVAGDSPFADRALAAELLEQFQSGDEAVVPCAIVDGRERLEPLIALYDREAFMREGEPILRNSFGAVKDVVARLKTRRVQLSRAEFYANINTAGEYRKAFSFSEVSG
ncbi:MAG: molybdenum cofactor guanylyltransferase [Candidatus Eremiobacteraeota bacterium]|nr:molybdenum cofactor guanylyltransferase [Candidatus Eremiobacteraeota bacterium]